MKGRYKWDTKCHEDLKEVKDCFASIIKISALQAARYHEAISSSLLKKFGVVQYL